MSRLGLTVNEDIKNRVTYLLLMRSSPRQRGRLHPRRARQVAVAHSTFTDDSLSLIVRSSEGVLRRARTYA
ncbi:MAG: hypothetical protein IPI67_02440 [Myxococcales bacterium]|nr:hypothetical protein [Myxococcales bacterium]